MKYNSNKFPFNEYLKRSKFFFIITYSIFSIFFSLIRTINRLFSLKEGSVVVIALHRLGDTVFTIPAIREITKYYKRNKIVIVCFASSIPIYKLAFNNLDYCLLDKNNFYFGERIANSTARKKLKSLRPYRVIDLTATLISASLIFNLRAKEIIGINGYIYKKIYDQFILFRKKPKLVDNYLDAISFITESRIENNVKRKVDSNPEGKILIHPFASMKEKEWNFKKFSDLAQRLNLNYKVNIIAQSNVIHFDVKQEILYSGIGLLTTQSSEELIYNISKCSLFIGNDSGPVNIANFLNKPTLTIYGCTNPDYTASDDDHQIYIQRKIKCSADKNEKFCLIGFTYSCSGTQCMNETSVEKVYNRIIPLIEKYCIKNC